MTNKSKKKKKMKLKHCTEIKLQNDELQSTIKSMRTEISELTSKIESIQNLKKYIKSLETQLELTC